MHSKDLPHAGFALQLRHTYPFRYIRRFPPPAALHDLQYLGHALCYLHDGSVCSVLPCQRRLDRSSVPWRLVYQSSPPTGERSRYTTCLVGLRRSLVRGYPYAFQGAGDCRSADQGERVPPVHHGDDHQSSGLLPVTSDIVGSSPVVPPILFSFHLLEHSGNETLKVKICSSSRISQVYTRPVSRDTCGTSHDELTVRCRVV